MSFLYGVMSHQVADYMWYGEDKYQQGFLNMMAKVHMISSEKDFFFIMMFLSLFVCPVYDLLSKEAA